ncbi:MAG: type III-B CRISPR module RAMP protein Cmr1, partial [Thermodesulfobacteriota bacterium]|nr:type III-B CRISPR module RAMP protein Cmr1 [Thermodesulfobacteriota bacterium]
MKLMEIKVTFLTPAFLYGADQSKPEFRIPSLIGQMRYWWRMTQDWSDIENLREKEGEVFGLVAGNKARAKPFFIHLKDKSGFTIPQPEPVLQRDDKQATDRLGNLLFQFPSKKQGISYFFYPFMRRPGRFHWLPDGLQVSLGIDFSKPATDDTIRQVFLSLFLLARFGGLGSRSRRGAGGIEIEGNELFDLTENDLLSYIIASSDKKTLPGHAYFSLIDSKSPIFRALSNSALRFKQFKPEASTWQEALDPIGCIMQRFRTKQRLLAGNTSGVDPDFVQEARDLHQYYENPSTDPPSALSKDAFGLPRVINFTSCRPAAWNALTISPYKKEGKEIKEMRRASPLHITVNRDDNQYYCTLLVLWDLSDNLSFLPDGPDGIDICIKRRGNKDKDTYPKLENP